MRAQISPPGVRFETASVKPAARDSIRNFVGGPGTRVPGQVAYTNASLKELILRAYGLDDPKTVAGPNWVDVERYDVTAKLPAGTDKEQLQKMLQTLLIERFKLQIHHEPKDVPAYDLVVAESGLKLKESKGAAAVESKPDLAYPDLPAGPIPALAIVMDGSRGRLKARQEPPFVLARMLSGPAGRPVVDKTGVTTRYDFTLDFDLHLAPGDVPKEITGPVDDPAPSLFDALLQKLGLKLVESRTMIDLLVIDQAERTPAGD